MVSAKSLWANGLQGDAKNSNFKIFKNALYVKSGNMPLILYRSNCLEILSLHDFHRFVGMLFFMYTIWQGLHSCPQINSHWCSQWTEEIRIYCNWPKYFNENNHVDKESIHKNTWPACWISKTSKPRAPGCKYTSWKWGHPWYVSQCVCHVI